MMPGTSVEHIVVNVGAQNKTHLGSFKITKKQNMLRPLLNGERVWSKRVAQLNLPKIVSGDFNVPSWLDLDARSF